MKLLWVMPYLPSPSTFGGQRRIEGLAQAIAARHDVSILALHSSADPLERWLAETRAWCHDVEVFPQRTFGLDQRRKRLAQLATLALPWSWESASHFNRHLRHRIAQRLRDERWDAVVVEFAQTAVNLPRVVDVPVLLDEHNIEFDLKHRTATTSDSKLRQVFASAEWRKLRREEHAAWSRVAAVAATSDRDVAFVREQFPERLAAVVPNGVDLDRFRPPDVERRRGPAVFFGAHNYFPNADGLRFLFGEIWPLVTEAVPAARVRIVGPHPDPDVAAMAPSGVEIVGFVDDVVAEVSAASIALAPLRVGGGTRLKIVEAMALGRPVVSTTLGAEGIDAVDGRDIIIADTARDFADAIIRLLGDPTEARRIGADARTLVEQRYGWTACAAAFEALLDEMVGAGSKR
jgi:glycosyltransferase involved in cell wall biosynthesis